ncbi:MAG: putative ABC transporter permease [Candidatus Gastranaerophilales bacterium]|nr:putative ABC transporter permease [Candidatus Gastranaerophilales bacterium]
MKQRTFDFYVLLFFLISFAGWLWEVGLYLVTEHALINRGVYQGPYLPIYGVGGLLLWFLLQRLHEKPVWTFLLSAALCSVLEYATSVILEWRWGVRWWDYEGHFLNLNGRICLLGAVCFGLGGMALNCYLLPLYMKLYHRIARKWRLILCGVFLTVFVLDITYCAVRPNAGYGITQSAAGFAAGSQELKRGRVDKSLLLD